MKIKYKGYTLEITQNDADGDFVATWKGISGEADTMDEACRLCWELIQEEDPE